MRIFRFILMLIAILALALPGVANANSSTKDCVPFAAKDVPDESQPEWEFYNERVSKYTEPDGSEIVTERARYYRNNVNRGLKLGVYEIFGKLAFKAWACRSSGEDPVTKDTADHMIAVFTSDGKWVTAYAQRPERYLEVDPATGRVTALTLILRDQSGTALIKRVIARPTR